MSAQLATEGRATFNAAVAKYVAAGDRERSFQEGAEWQESATVR